MPGVQTIVNRLNVLFASKIGTLAANREVFAPGKLLTPEAFREIGIVAAKEKALIGVLEDFVARVPKGFLELFRSVIYYSLTTTPPTQITFAWAPAFDFEFTMWQVDDTVKTRGGITVLVKSPYSKD